VFESQLIAVLVVGRVRATAGAHRARPGPGGAPVGILQGHRLRLQIASAAHPFYDRNLGTGEPIVIATATIAAGQAIHCGTAAHPSGITVRLEA
jgi:hypothetical protein